MSEVSASGRLNKASDPDTRIRSIVFGLASTTIRSSSSPIFEIHATTSRFGVWRFVLVIPTTIMTKILHLTIPRPFLSDPESTNFGSIEGIFRGSVELVPVQSLRLFVWLGHIDGVTINLSVLETITGQKIILGGVGSVFELALYTDVDTGRSDVLGPDPRLSVLACVVCITGSQFGSDWIIS